jgi:hypothetical protein
VTLLQDIQAEATESTVPVSTVLRRAQILASRLGHEPLKQWTRSELQGYTDPDALPDYRVIGMGMLPVKAEFIHAGGILSGVPIAPSQVPEFARERLFTMRFMQGAAEYETLLATGLHEFPTPWTGDEVAGMRQVLPGLSTAAQMVPANTIAGLLDAIRNRILDFSLEIWEENPDAGEAAPGTEPVPQAAMNNIFNTTIMGDHNVVATAGRDAVTISHDRIDAAWPDLQKQLTALGVPSAELAELEMALRTDGDPGTELGPNTQTWIARMTTKVATGAIVLGQSASVEVVVHVLLKALGLS